MLLSEVDLYPNQEEMVKLVYNAIKDGDAGKEDINVIIHFHQSSLEQEKIKSISEYETRIWLLDNVLRFLDDKHLNVNVSPSIEYELMEIEWVITALVNLDKIMIDPNMNKKIRRVRFATQFRKIMKAEIYLGNKAIGSEVDLADTINHIIDDDSIC